MSEMNPYAAPVAENIPHFPTALQYREMEEKPFLKLYYRSCNVSAIGALLILAALGTGVTLYHTWDESLLYRSVLLVAIVVQLTGIVGIISRAVWGRVVGMICCGFMVLWGPLGTIIGIAGIFAFSRAGDLFGKERVSHKDLKADFDRRQKEKKAAKKQAKLERKAERIAAKG